MRIGVPKETMPGEARVALTPDALPRLTKAGLEIVLQAGAGIDAGYPDAEYQAKGASIEPEASAVLGDSDMVVKVRRPGDDEIGAMKEGTVLLALLDPLRSPELVAKLAERRITSLSLELIPRITRAQSMDVLSSQSTVSGYKAVLVAASHLPRMFPMLMTAAGTLAPARVLILGAGVAGLQAIATAKRLGSVVEAYDVRAAVKEQIQSLGARFVELDLGTKDAEDKGGYAKQLTEDDQVRQRQALAKVIAGADVVISTALIPGRPAPLLVTAEAVQGMKPGSVVVDLAAEAGGNCELTEPGETVVKHGVTLVGHTNLPATVPFHASQMFARNVQTLLLELWKKGEKKDDGELAAAGRLDLDTANEIVAGILVTRDGEVVHPRLKPATAEGAVK